MPGRFTCLNTYSSAAGAVWESCGNLGKGGISLEEKWSLGAGLEVL